MIHSISPSTLRLLVQDFDELVAAGLLQDTLSDAATFLSAYLDYEEEHDERPSPETLRLIVLPGLGKDGA